MSYKPNIGLKLYSNLRVQFDLLQSENRKLREALRKIAQHDGCSGKVMDTAWEMVKIPEEALHTESNSTSSHDR